MTSSFSPAGESIRSIFHDSSLMRGPICWPRSLQITRIGTTYKASLLGSAIQFLMTLRSNDTYVAYINRIGYIVNIEATGRKFVRLTAGGALAILGVNMSGFAIETAPQASVAPTPPTIEP